MTENVAIPKDLFEKMVDAVNELEAVYHNMDRDDEAAAGPEHEFEAARIEKLVEEIEENWPEESFSGQTPRRAPVTSSFARRNCPARVRLIKEAREDRPPMISAYHLETDAALNPARKRVGPDEAILTFAGGGAVVRTGAMLRVATYEIGLGYVGGSHEAEALALLRGMELARKRHGATALRARTDNLPLVRALAGEIAPSALRFVAVLDRIRTERERFEKVDVRWAPGFHRPTRPDGLPSADVLARKAAGLEPRTGGR